MPAWSRSRSPDRRTPAILNREPRLTPGLFFWSTIVGTIGARTPPALGAAVLWPAVVSASAGIHAWTAGAIGLMTLAVMTRASLGHTGQKLAASTLAFVAALLRIGAAFANSAWLIEAAGLGWVAAFFGFAVVYGSPLVELRPARASAK